ncbi:hemicentin-1-like isoform X2 [Mizuhopecten yessoensis]|uniref:hemicentin-1-like isoform X2 n=1 Tax=Mizuhopecten yessoensis TaxID=6573 RepID=UPI000B459FA2|nr:hemicentin-1-like isoform X2 [Mizuhopecten yessoensis]
MSDIYLQQQIVYVTHREPSFYLFIVLLTIRSSTDAVTLTGSSEYAVPGSEFTLTCDVPEEANSDQLYRRPDVTAVASIQIAGSQCYNTATVPPVLCSPDVCSCTTTSTNYGTVFQWVIQPQTGDHGSVWFCRRSNPSLPEADRIVESPDYTLNVADSPGTVTLSPPGTTYTRTEGDTLPDITCTADCRPGCTFVWTKPDNTNFTASAVLSLGQLDRSEHGTYRCTARNVVGESTTTTSVTVQYGPGTVTLSPPDTTYTRTDGDTLPDITCTADCRPGCTFVWTKPDNTSFTASAVLSLGQLVRSEHGTYRCTARNVVGELTTITSITILYGPSTVRLTPSTTSYTPIEGHAIPTVTCSSDCNPVCTYSWAKDGQSHKTGSDLQLTNIQRGQTGVYMCTASNGYGSRTSSDVSVTVNYGPGDSISFQPRQDVLDRVENQTVPDIVCSADCEPPCTYIWSKAGTTYINPLSVSTAIRGNAGQYTCTATNSVSQGTNTWNLIVRFPPQIVNLSYTQGDADVTENGSKSLVCYVESYPPSTIQWYFKANNTVLLTTPDVLDSTYTLAAAVCLDTGVYTCSARNSVSNMEATRDININVLCKPHPYEVTDYNQAISISTSAKLILPAVFISNPKPSFTWTFQNSKLTPATELLNGIDNFYVQNKFVMMNLSAVSEGTRTDIQEIWFGLYNATATNSQGSTMISFMVQEKQSPSFPKRLTVGCAKPYAAKVSWKDGGHAQYYQVFFSTDEFLQSNQPYPVTVTEKEAGRVMYSLDINNLEGGQLYYFKVAAFNEYGNTTSLDAVGCTVQQALSCGSDSMYITGLVLICVAVVTLLCTVGLGIFIKRNGGLPFLKCRHPHPGEIQSVQLSERRNVNEAHTKTDREEEGLQYEQLDTNAIAKPSVYSETGSHHHGYQNNPVNDGQYESLGRRFTENVYDECQSRTSGNKGIYVNTTNAGSAANSGECKTAFG